MQENLNDKTWFKECLNNKELISKIEKIKLVITDIDGCLTDGNVLLSEGSNICTMFYKYLAKAFSTQDGFATNKIVKNNLIQIAFLSGRKDKVTIERAKVLGLPKDMCFTGVCGEKINIVKKIQENKNVSIEETLYFGDDFLDFETKPRIGLFACPQNAPFYFQDAADITVPKIGGQHAFRLLLDLVLYVQKKHFAQEFIENSLR